MKQARNRPRRDVRGADASRRTFLAAALALPAMAAAPLAATGPASPAAGDAAAASTGGYRLTEHIAMYYRLAGRL